MQQKPAKNRSAKPHINQKACCIQELTDDLDALFFRALSEPVRLELLKILIMEGPLDVESVAERLPQDRSVISRHLSALRAANLLIATRDGRRVVYSVNGGTIVKKIERLLSRFRNAIMVCCPEQLK